MEALPHRHTGAVAQTFTRIPFTSGLSESVLREALTRKRLPSTVPFNSVTN